MKRREFLKSSLAVVGAVGPAAPLVGEALAPIGKWVTVPGPTRALILPMRPFSSREIARLFQIPEHLLEDE